MRRRMIVLVLLVVGAVLALGAIAAWRTAGGGPGTAATPGAPGFPTRTVESGAVTVTIEPSRVDTTGAAFRITFETHSVALDLDVARSAHLTVGTAEWGSAAWSGDAPGGHHRSGNLRFTSAGPPTGTVELHLTGLPEPVTATWTLPAS